MRMFLKNTFTIKNAGIAFVLLVGISQQTQAGMPVIDISNLEQNIVSAVQQVAAVEKQIQQYQTQLQQYQNMLQNTAAPSAYIWDQASQVMNKLMVAQDTLSYYKKKAGSIDSYLSRYQDVNYYRTSPCFTAAGCSSSQLQALQDAQANNSEALKHANDAVLKGIDQQQQTLISDAATLQKLQLQATTAQGQMQALQAANQLASAQTNQLLQIRSMLAAQATAAATRASNDADKAALMEAADQRFRSGSYTKSPVKKW
ncbi:P-type conjugative transfer protein TrbJ (plasmid) [Xylella fastidiosa subsp. fastidiosa]|uniref:TrbJ n=4 Tax=Xylella fastidiosa TaxID=2371 RepID=L7SSL9_XYLFS|nr:P-type conjugative transfer protein TrbJ [Xylella fastidiosa]ACB93626.1 P-type conjugative transfer protein TrbJ [Xylella fastidiosa M23]AGC23488.1 trbJ [Xylella fastidiosa subsp. multiplex]MBE0262989.1 P-type conjugative transfer protein TrbJ [Xylella fastidiosa subsp. fastidiosa]MBE0265332.1 P-type conjugative transfer protein TrbJ [Xylella fastidiosa subsp. fastidiosa]MBE0267418.1 P-type conjugative transfer protein TrbJ [Xylella fastidiosa subsp. fastidiosa]